MIVLQIYLICVLLTFIILLVRRAIQNHKHRKDLPPYYRSKRITMLWLFAKHDLKVYIIGAIAFPVTWYVLLRN